MKDSNNVNVLYNTLRKDGYTDLGTLSDFGFNLTDTNNRKALYATLKKDGYTDLGDFSDFETNLGYAPLDDDPVAKAKKDATSWMESMQPKKMEEFFTEKVETPKRLPSRPKDFGQDFYDELKRTGIDNLGDYSSFQARMADPDNRKALYETMKAQGRWSADYDDLDKYIQYTMVPQEKIDDGIKYEKEWFGLDMARRLGAGLNDMFSGAFGLLDKGASTVQDGVNAVNRFIGLPEEQGGLFRDIADYFKEGAEINRALSNRYGQDNYASLWEKGDYAGAFGDVMLNATESIPMSVAAMVATYCGVPAAGLVGIGSVTASQKYDQLNEEHPEMSYAAKMINASLTGLAEGGSEMLGAGVSKVWMSALYKRFGKDAAEDMVRRGVLGYLKSASRRYGIFFEPIEEGLEEVSSQFAENVTDKFTGADPNRKISDGLMDSFVYGVGGGMQFSAAHLPSYVSHKGWREQWDPTTRDLERMQNQYDIAEAAQNPGSVRSAGQEMANAAAQLDAADENTQQLAGQYRDASKGERESLLNSLTDEKQKLTLEAYWNAYDNVQALADNAEMQARAAVRQDFNDNVKPYITSIPELNNGEKSVVTATLNSRGGDQQVRVKSMDAHTAVIFDESAPNGVREVLRSQLSNISASNVNDLYQESLNKAREEQKKKLEWQYMHNAKTEAPRQGLVVYNGNQAFLLQGQNQNGDWMAVTAVVDSKSGQIVPAKNATPIQMTEAEVLQLQDSYYDAQENGGTAPTQQGASQGQTTSAQQEQTAGSTQTMDNQSQPTAQPTTTEAAPQESALSRIPKDEKGRPIYEQADPNTTFDAIVEQTNGNEEMAQQIAEEMVKDKEAELKKAEKAAAKSGTTIEKKIAAKQAVETAKAEFEYWQNVANVQNNRVTNVTEDTKNAENQINPEATSEQIDNSTELNVEPTTETSIEESSPGNTPTLRDVVNILYTKGKAYASKMFERSFFNVVKTPDFMKALGLSGEIFTIKYGVISRHFSKDGSHNFTEAEWEQLPSALEKPFAIARLDDKKNGYRLYTSLKNSKGEYVVVGVDVKNAGRDIEVNAISTIFGRRSDANLPLNEQVIYRSKEITPDQEALLGRPNSDQYPTERELSTDKNNDSSENNQTKSEENSSVGNTQMNEARTEGGEQTNAPTESNQKRKDTAEPTRRQKLSPEKRKAVERIAKRLGTSVTWVDTMEDNGTYDSETKNIRIAMDAENPLVEVFGHESLHRIKELGGKSYSQLRDALKAFEGEEAWASRMDEIRNRYEGSFDGMNLTDEEINAYYEEEAVADALGEMINNREMVTELANRMDHGVLAKIRDILGEIVEAIGKAFGKNVPEEVQRIKDLKKVVDRAYMEAKKNAQMEAQKPQPGTRQSKRKKVSNNIFDIAEEKIKAREENSESSAPIVREQKAGETKPTHAEQVLRDVVIDHLRKSGMDVITGQEEGQRVLDMANGEDVRMNAKKRRALETASLGNSPRSLTVISSADGAKVLNNIDNLAKELDNSATQPKTFIGDVAKALAATRDNSKSEYATFETKNGNVVTIRIANHNATVSNFDNRGEQEGISIVISPKENTGITNDGNAHITEYYYDAIKLRKAEGKPLAEIVKSIKQALYSGEFKDTTGLAETQEVNANEAARLQKVYHGSGAEFDHFDHSHMGEGEGAQAYGWGTYVTEVEGIGRVYANAVVDVDAPFRDMEYTGNNLTPREVSMVAPAFNGGERTYDETVQWLQGINNPTAKKALEILNKTTADEWTHPKQGRRHLYTIDIPDDNGKNYLDWNNHPSEDILKTVGSLLEKDGYERTQDSPARYEKGESSIVLNSKATGADLYAELQEALGSDKAASNFLSKAGFTGIKYPADNMNGGRADGAKNYVIFNEADAKITDHVRYFRTAKGDAYGFTINGKIYIDPRIANAETPIHEYTHLWATALRQGNPKEWQNVVQLMKGTKEWDEVKKLYPELESEDAIADEVLAQYSGKRGAERLRAEARKIAEGKGSVMEAAEAITALQKIKQAVDKFWRGVADFLGIHFTTAEEVADRVMKDLLDGVDPRKFGKEEGLRLNQIKSATDNVGTFDASNDDIRYQFMGEKGAAAIDHAEEVTTRLDNLSIARSMEEAKKDAKAIKMATGWERGADGKWRYEIPDSKINDMLDVDGKGTMVKRSEEDMLWNGGKLGEYVVAPELFKAYPELKEIKLDTDTIVDDLDNGSYNPDTRTITIHAYDLKALNSILNHEIQHAIQHIEGFAQGGNAEMYVDKERVSELKERRSVIEEEIANGNYDNEEELQNIEMELFDLEEDMPFYKYRHLSGEVEARNVQKRMRMTDEERRNSLASETEDVSREDQIFLFGDGGESMAMSHEQQAANERFNSELTRYQNGEMDKNEILHLGRPQGVMRAFLPNLPIVMRQRVIKKGSEKKHEVDVSAIRDMPQHLSSPIFVFQRSEDTIGVLTDMRDRNGKNVCVAIELKRQMQQGAEYLEVNDVRSFHGREFKNIVEPIANNKTLKWVDKEKGLAYLSSASQPVQQEIDKQVLDTAAKVVKDFANPNISDENVAGEGKTLLDSIELNKIAEDRKKMYDSVLSGNFDDVTLQQIDNYIDNVTPNNRYWRPLSQRLPSGVERGMRKGERTSAVDVLFSRISESAVPANERTGADAKRRIEEKKKELLKGWAIATGNWHTDISDFTDAKEPMGSGKDSDVYQSKDGHSVIKVSKGKEHLKKFRPDIDAVALFNHLFPNSHYEILGYGEIDGKFVKFLKQPIVDFTNSTPLTVDERVDYMAKLGFKPINEEKTAFSNGTIIAADVQGNNIVRDSAGNIRVIDADVKLHTKDIGGEYSYPAVETDTMLHQDNSQENSSRPTRRSIRKKPTANAFDQAEEVVRFRDEAKASAVVGGTDNMVVVEKKIGAAKEQYERTLRTSSYQVQEALQDSLLSLKVLQDAVAEATKGKILDYENSYMAAIALSSKSLAEQELFRATACRGITSAMAALEREGMSAEQQNDYLIAKHGIERNRYMAVREALAQDEETFKAEMDAYEADRDAIRNNGKSWIEQQRELDRLAKKYGADLTKDYSGLTQDFVPTNSDEGIDYDRDAVYAAVEAIEKKYTMQGLLDAVKTANEVILAKQYESGLIDKKTFDKVSNMYQFYVPLRGWDETTADEVYAYINTERPVSNAPMKEAHGRKSKADNVLATIFNMGESGIMQGNRNLVKQKFLQMAQDHNTDAISVSDIWVKYNDVSGEWEAVFPQIPQNATPEEVRDIVEKFDEKMKVLSKMPNAEVKRESELADVGYKILPKELNEHQVIVKRGGKTYVLTINGNPRAAQALNGLTNPDSPTGIYKLVENTAGKFNRFLAANFTTRNPNFVVSNFLRDAIYSNSTVWVKESPAYAWSFNTNFAKVNPLKMYSLVQRYAKGQLDMNNEIEKAYRDFILNGGETGYTNLRDIDKIKKKIRNELKDANGKVSVRKAFKALGETMDLFNKSVENCARFAAYLTSIEHGRSIDRAVNDAKEISVNFNKKGSGSRFLGAEGETAAGNIASAISGAGRAGYIFWNAGIQGLTNFWTLAKNHRKKFLTLAAGNYLLGALMPIIAEATGGDDDDSDYYDLPEYVRRSNICFRNGFGGWVTIPLSVEFRTLYGLGELSSSALIGKEQLSKKQLAIKVAEQISQIMPLDMMEGGGGFSALVPSSIKPIVEASQNKDWTGLPLYKDNDFNKGMPEWTKVFKSTSPALVNMSKYANELSGGDKYTVGAVNFNPANVEHILSGYFGGVATSIFQLVKSANIIFGDREYDPRDIPIVNRVVKRGDERTKKKAIDNQYYENLEEMDKLEQRLKGYKKEATTPTNDIFELAGYQEKLNKLMQSDEYKRYRQAENIKELIKNLSNYSKRGNSDELEDLSYQYKKLLNDIMREKSE